MPTKNLYCIIGESGSGKTTLVNRLRDYGYEPVPSYTDRAPRHPGEEGHTFLTTEEFTSKLGGMVAYTEFDDHRYGADPELLNACSTYVIDPAGVYYLKHAYKDRPIKIIYISCPEDVRLYRMVQRGDPVSDARRRIEHDNLMFTLASQMANIKLDGTRSKDYLLWGAISYIGECEREGAV